MTSSEGSGVDFATAVSAAIGARGKLHPLVTPEFAHLVATQAHTELPLLAALPDKSRGWPATGMYLSVSSSPHLPHLTWYHLRSTKKRLSQESPAPAYSGVWAISSCDRVGSIGLRQGMCLRVYDIASNAIE